MSQTRLEPRYGVLNTKTVIALLLALTALCVSVWAFSEHLFVQDVRQCWIDNGRLVCLHEVGDDLPIRQEDVTFDAWASHIGK